MKVFKRWASDGWRTLAIVGVGLLVVGGLFLFRLNSQTPAASPSEVSTTQSATDYHQLIDNPSFAPQKILIYGLHVAHWDNLFTVRLVSVIIALTVVLCFYFLMKLWSTPLVAVLTTLLLMTSGWFLHYARLGTPGVMYGTLLILVALGVSLDHSNLRKSILLALLGFGTLALYVPGMIWFVLFGLIWRRKLIWQELRKVPAIMWCLYIAVFLVVLAPLALAIFRQPNLGRVMLGLPDQWPTVIEFVKRLFIIPVELFLRGPDNPTLWLGRLPLLDIFCSVMAVAGLYVIIRKWQFDRSKLLVGVLTISAILIAIGGAVQMSILIPFIYALVAIGIAYMLEEWFSVFPRNPLARNIGMALIIVAVAVSCFYNVMNYFVAWYHAPATRSSFNQKLR